MSIQIFILCAASPEVRAVLGEDPVRLWPFGLTDESPAYPYAVYQIISGAPDMYLDRVPDADAYTVQVDVYAKDMDSLTSAVIAIRDAIEPHSYITNWRGQDIDPDTKNTHQSFDVDWIVRR